MGSEAGKILVAVEDDICVIKLVGDIRVSLCATMEETIKSMIGDDKNYRDILVNLMEASGIDSTSLGLLAKLSLYAQEHYQIKPTIVSTDPSITKLLQAVGFPQIFNILTSLDESCASAECQECIQNAEWSEEQIKDKVIEAHKVLMSLNEANKSAFCELVSNLEQN